MTTERTLENHVETVEQEQLSAVPQPASGKSRYLIWWTSQVDLERIVPLENWPMYLYDEFQSRRGRAGRGRLWRSDVFDGEPGFPEGVQVRWDETNNWLCRAASDAGGIVIYVEDVAEVQFLPGFVTTFDMTLPGSN